MKPNNHEESKIDLVVGVGMDDPEGHTRVTSGDNFMLYGGSEETHGIMQDKMAELTEKLRERGKEINDLQIDEFKEIAAEIGLINE